MKKNRDLGITEQEVFLNWLNSLPEDQAQAWSQDTRELARLVGIQAEPEDQTIPEEDKPKAWPFAELMRCLWMIHQAGYPLPVLQSLREGKGP